MVPDGKGVLTASGHLQPHGVSAILHLVAPRMGNCNQVIADAVMTACAREVVMAMALKGLKSASLPILGAGR